MEKIPFNDLADFEYVGGGYFRKKGFNKGETAPILHGPEVLKLVQSACTENETLRQLIKDMVEPGADSADLEDRLYDLGLMR